MNQKITIIKGLIASIGQAKARALIIQDPMKPATPINSDYIVVAPYTTPVLNMILLNAKGIVCETGGMTTHAAIISRELGIPCIMSVKGILDAVKDGQILEIKADTGEVVIYE